MRSSSPLFFDFLCDKIPSKGGEILKNFNDFRKYLSEEMLNNQEKLIKQVTSSKNMNLDKTTLSEDDIKFILNFSIQTAVTTLNHYHDWINK